MEPDLPKPPVYSEGVVNIPLLWMFRGINGEWRQQCDDHGALERWNDVRGLGYDTEGEAIGDFC